MNREILFKAKQLDNDEWVEGYYRADPDLDIHFICGWDYYTSENGLEREPFEYEINQETICQYTGLTDKNGRKIWENDIVSDERTFTLAAVKWFDDDYAGWHLYDNLIGEQQVTYGSWGECEVIGNVFDNMELLEVDRAADNKPD